MNTYVIAPQLVRVNLDEQLSNSFADLNKRLKWRPLTTNLDSCEEAPYLYFRISLELTKKKDTYAGFATGAPFMLTRDIDVNKRAFFLRHWVRKVNPADNHDAPITPQSHMVIGAQGNRLLIRVEIDRKLESSNTFKSIPFATWMFQVVQVDAIVHEMPHVRLAFAIERTVTSEERDFIASVPTDRGITATAGTRTGATSRDSTRTRAMPHHAVGSTLPNGTASTTTTPPTSRKQTTTTATTSNMQKSTGGTTGIGSGSGTVGGGGGGGSGSGSGVPTRHTQPSPVFIPAMQQSVMYGRSQMFGAQQNMRQPSLGARPSSNAYQHNPYNFVSARHAAMQMRQQVPSRPAPIAPHAGSHLPHVPRAVNHLNNRNYMRQTGSATNTSATAVPVTAAINILSHYPAMSDGGARGGGHTHPDVRLWEEHDINDAYEPIYITEDLKFEEKARKTILVEGADSRDDRFDCDNLFGLPTPDFPPYYVNGPVSVGVGDEADIEICVTKRRKVTIELPPRAADGNGDLNGGDVETGEERKYTTAVIAAAHYNSSLREERTHLKRWLLEDAERREEQSDDDDEDGDGGSSSE